MLNLCSNVKTVNLITLQIICEYEEETNQLIMEDCVFNDEGFDESIDDFNFPVAPDPYDCTLQINVRSGEASYLKKLYSPMLEGMDPTFQFISINESDDVDSSFHSWTDSGYVEEDSSFLHCQAISVVLFLYEAFGRLSATDVQKNFNFSPWKFHHRVELPEDVKPRVTARQDFYQTLPELPLWSICPVHYGNEHLRFHIFVKNFTEMRSFYEVLTGKKATSGSPGFCFFTLYSQSGFDVQLSLKHLPRILPEPSNSVRLKLKIKDISAIMHLLSEPPVKKEHALWIARDPDGNELVLEETEPNSHGRKKGRLPSNASLDTSDYETASIETDSLAGSMNQSPQGTLNSRYSERFTLI